jgi:Ca2+-binding EF-hand superfamily protein
MNQTPTTVLVFTLAFGGAMVLSDGTLATPRPGDDGQLSAATGALVAPRAAVALPARRAALADPDLDGVVSRAEAARYYEARFSLIDRDRDGRLSGREFLRSAVIDSVPMLKDSWATPLGFEAVDVDGNGARAPEELLRANGWLRTWSNGAGADEHRQATFDLLDADHDAALSKREFTDGGAEHFAARDADGDGKVTIPEFYGGKRL